MPMAKSPNSFLLLQSQLKQSGFASFGAFHFHEELCAGRPEFIGKKGFLFGNAGPAMWEVFSRSREYKDGQPDPMNLWTKRVTGEIASVHGCATIYPFDKPFWPFQRVARHAMQLQASPLGILVHPQYGLWHAFRGAFVFGKEHPFFKETEAHIARQKAQKHPCDNCIEKPCLNRCPVGAFSGGTLDVKTCFSHLDSGQEPGCMQEGCQARLACPVGPQYRYEDAQIRFHMDAYRG